MVLFVKNVFLPVLISNGTLLPLKISFFIGTNQFLRISF